VFLRDFERWFVQADSTAIQRPGQWRAGVAWPGAPVKRATCAPSFTFADFIADYGTNCGAAEHANRTAEQNRAANGTNSGAGCGIPLARVHTRATDQAEQNRHGHRTD
jgi:hypothetical protein